MNYFSIRSLPPKGEKIAVDTQIIYWVFYASDAYMCLQDKPYQIPMYSEYIKDICENGNEIIIFGGVLIELFKIIERNEYKMYLEYNGWKEDELSLKEYRKIEEERMSVQKKISIAYKQIEQICDVRCDFFEIETCEAFIEEFAKHKADFVDYSLVGFCKREQIKNILTDDADFKTIDGEINIFSGNKAYKQTCRME